MDEEEGEALILKDISVPEDKDAIYEIVDDERELDAVAEIFSDMLDDIDLENNPGVCAVRRFYIGEAFLPAAIFR